MCSLLRRISLSTRNPAARASETQQLRELLELQDKVAFLAALRPVLKEELKAAQLDLQLADGDDERLRPFLVNKEHVPRDAAIHGICFLCLF